jgi:GNAT superfamily N-acetyltransferase
VAVPEAPPEYRTAQRTPGPQRLCLRQGGSRPVFSATGDAVRHGHARRCHRRVLHAVEHCTLRLHDLPEDIAERLPRYPLIPATLIGRLAIDRRHHGQGWGSFLLLDALHRCTRSQVASFAVIVDAIDDDARAFYVHEGFLPLPDTPRRLFRRMSDIEALFK